MPPQLIKTGPGDEAKVHFTLRPLFLLAMFLSGNASSGWRHVGHASEVVSACHNFTTKRLEKNNFSEILNFTVKP